MGLTLSYSITVVHPSNWETRVRSSLKTMSFLFRVENNAYNETLIYILWRYLKWKMKQERNWKRYLQCCFIYFVETTGHTEEDLLEAFRSIDSPEELQQIINSFVQIDFSMGQIDKIRESARNVINDLTDEGQ